MAQQDINGTAVGEFSLDDSKKQGTRLIEIYFRLKTFLYSRFNNLLD